MSSTTPAATTGSTAGVRWRERAIAVLLAVLAPVVVWVVAVPIAGVDLEARTGSGQPAMEIGLGSVIFTALLMSLLGWALLAVLERFTRRAGLIWTVIAAIVLVLSLAGPTTGLTGGAKVTLALMHLAVGAVLIPLLRRSAKS